jgi:hypothetical protein
LSTEAEQLVRAGRAVLQPSEADRERVFQSLLSKVGAPTGSPDRAAELSRAPTFAKATVVKVSGVLVGLCVVGGGLFWLLRPNPEAEEDAAVPAIPALAPPKSAAAGAPETRAPLPPLPTVSETPAPAARSEARESPAPRAPARSARRAPLSPPGGDSLAREVALLSRASAELHAGRFSAALDALDEHQRSFPNGTLAQERIAARARALCALGRMNEGQAELTRLARAAPGSPHAARAARACSVPGAERK